MTGSAPLPSPTPLGRFKVLDLTRVRSGPTCVRHLADWGAEVLKIEPPENADRSKGMGGARHGPDFQNLHRNKRGLTLNLKAPEGLEIFQKLVAGADVVVENYRPDVKTRLGIDYPALKKINPRIILGSISGFGQDGPYANRPGFDQIAQGMGGLMSITGLPGQGPVRAGVPIADLSAGNYLAMGILVALLEREVSGEGQWVKTSLIEAMIAMLDFQAARWLIASDVPGQAGNNHPTTVPTGVFKTKDGYINIAGGGDVMWERISETLEAPHLLSHPDFGSEEARKGQRDAVNAAIEAETVKRTSAEWIELFNRTGVPAGPIYAVDEMFADPQVQHMKMNPSVDHPVLGETQVVGQAVSMSRSAPVYDRATPERGAHTEEILAQLGYDADQLADLRAREII